jgi:hypothetical protein
MNIAEEWELNVFEGIINQVNAGTFDPTLYGVNASDVEGMEPVMISYMAQRSIPDELVSQAQ